MINFIAVANIENGGHYITSHSFSGETHALDSAFKIWLNEMAEEIGFKNDLIRLMAYESAEFIDGLDFVGRSSFAFGDRYEHCIVTFVILGKKQSISGRIQSDTHSK